MAFCFIVLVCLSLCQAGEACKLISRGSLIRSSHSLVVKRSWGRCEICEFLAHVGRGEIMIVPFDGAEASFSIYKGPVSGIHSRAHFLEEREFIEFGTRGHKTLKVCTCLVPNLLAVDALDRAGHQHKMAQSGGRAANCQSFDSSGIHYFFAWRRRGPTLI